ncbi:hypothetical protein Hypma_008312 [Hypsizygus marmoreus]|uniref:Uncharacterized protein n=1 Tax=Hypsizygus marmoreus TaxID=39966 RepID=A0A369JTF0_HYPMA|nr:hypothetical protein Hypma_008312 [Hypsizygus marmoreus]
MAACTLSSTSTSAGMSLLIRPLFHTLHFSVTLHCPDRHILHFLHDEILVDSYPPMKLFMWFQQNGIATNQTFYDAGDDHTSRRSNIGATGFKVISTYSGKFYVLWTSAVCCCPFLRR